MAPDPQNMMEQQWWPAPAKLNLFLHVTGQRNDGYHELQTLFQILDWGDRIRIHCTEDGEISRPDVGYDVPEEDDLVVRAARMLKEATNTTLGARIRVEKEIPMGAGLGGGSSDAATVLVALNRIWGCGLTAESLAELGLSLGADVPVFVHGHSAMATGVGEDLTPVTLGRRHYLLVMPEFAISTAQVFSDPELVRDSGHISVQEAVDGGGRNDCEPVSRRLYPALDRVFEALVEFGQPRMSGTGSSVFVEMASRAAADSAAAKLKCRYNVRAVGGLDQSTLQQSAQEWLH